LFSSCLTVLRIFSPKLLTKCLNPAKNNLL
jgi:hypothetical protein